MAPLALAAVNWSLPKKVCTMNHWVSQQFLQCYPHKHFYISQSMGRTDGNVLICQPYHLYSFHSLVEHLGVPRRHAKM